MKVLNGKKGILFLGMVAVAAVASWYFMFANIKGLNENISLLLERSRLEEKNVAAIRSIETVVNDSNSDIDKLNSYFIGKDGTVAFIESIESLGRKNAVAVSIDSVDVAGNSTLNSSTKGEKKLIGPSTELLKLKISAAGNWQDIFHFLSSLENMPFKLTISEADLASVSQTISTEKRETTTGWSGRFSIEILKLR